jgi:HSP20 family protein
MAEMDIKKTQSKTSDRNKIQERSAGSTALETEPSQGRGSLARRGMSSPFFSLTPRDFLTASPFELMRRFSEEMDRAFEGLTPWRGAMAGETGLWSPPIEVSEQDGSLVVCAELPGLNKDDVKVELTQDGLVIQGERKREHEERHEGWYRSERNYGSFYRLVPLPEEAADLEQARAQFDNGVLKVSIPIPESKRKRREIPIDAGGDT